MGQIDVNEVILDNEYVRIHKTGEDIPHSRDDRYVRLENSTATSISGLMQGLPMAIVGEMLSGAYRVEFPKGIAGALTPHGDGYLAIIRDPNTKRFLGQGTLHSLSDIGQLYTIFSALSVATNQYYLHEINQQLSSIQSTLDEVVDFLYTDKACELHAEAQAVFGIYDNYISIMACQEQRIASLHTIQQARILADRNIQFYNRNMKRLVEGKDTAEKLSDDLNYYTQAISLYGVCAVLEVVMSQNYDEVYLILFYI